MRLIDADKLLAPGYTDMFDEPIRFAMVSRNAIESAPTVKAIPIEWIERKLAEHWYVDYDIRELLEDWEKENETR